MAMISVRIQRNNNATTMKCIHEKNLIHLQGTDCADVIPHHRLVFQLHAFYTWINIKKNIKSTSMNEQLYLKVHQLEKKRVEKFICLKNINFMLKQKFQIHIDIDFTHFILLFSSHIFRCKIFI